MSQTTKQVADAAAWVAHLHGDQRTADSDRGLQLWLKEDPSRARVWEVTTEVWDEVGALQGTAIAQALKARRATRRARQRCNLFALAATVCISVAAVFFLLRDARISTEVGEQRTVNLEDGTRVFLNTDTHLIVRYNGHERRVEFTGGEALFDVASRAGRPFIVEANGREVRALGTAFLVRQDRNRITVTLTEGKVSVGDAGDPSPVVLAPGERMTYTEAEPPSRDHADIAKSTAWMRGQVILEGVPLREAVAEMNRYNVAPVSFSNPKAGRVLVSGMFRCGDSLSFAHAVAATYGLQVVDKGGRIQLNGAPQGAYRKAE